MGDDLWMTAKRCNATDTGLSHYNDNMLNVMYRDYIHITHIQTI